MLTTSQFNDKYRNTIVIAEYGAFRAETVYDIFDDRKPHICHRIMRIDTDEKGEEISAHVHQEFYTVKEMIQEFNDIIYGSLDAEYHIVEHGIIDVNNALFNVLLIEGKPISIQKDPSPIVELRVLNGAEMVTVFKDFKGGSWDTIEKIRHHPLFKVIFQEAFYA
uniref:Uncharacterized protein n=1 Tax=Ochrobactrum phage ORM_20 TaxID=2985243 RepID=A0A9N6ZGB4_9VIRU|nr:hypothetical protein ORM20_00161 [Ochrobactrum phage ORM_20]